MNQLLGTYHQPGIALEKNRRILLVDDNEAIHADFQKILGINRLDGDFDVIAAEMFGETGGPVGRSQFEMDFAYQGQEALEKVRAAVKAGRPYAMAFMDVRMPPGWDGLETTVRLWEVDPDIQIVICTAYSDYSWDEMMKMIPCPERLLILKKPFDSVEILQFAHSLTEKWALIQAARRNTDELNRTVNERTWELKSSIALLEAEMAGRKAADERGREHAMLIERGHDAIITCATNDVITSWNKGAERLYGWTAAEAIGRRIIEFQHATCTDEAACEARRALLEDGSWRGRLTQKAKDGRTLEVECHWMLMRNDDSSPKSIIQINTDVTEKTLLEAQFLRAQRLEGIGALATSIAHDLNNLLAPMRMSVDLLKSRETDESNRKFVNAIDRSSRQAMDVVKQVLLFAKGVHSRPVPLTPAYFIGEFEKLAQEILPRTIRFTAAVAPDTGMVKVDATQMQQVLLNLCVNARDAMPDGGDLAIRASNTTIDAGYAATVWGLAPGNYVRIDATDTGAGIPPDVMDRIFEPFFTTKGQDKGTGLGLSTVFGIMKNHNGAVTVDSKIGEGTTFHLYLPALPA